MLKAQRNFLTQFLTNPSSVGAIAPSSVQLAQEMVNWLDFKKLKVVVEYGCGTGVFTREILRHIQPETVFFALEINAQMVAHCKESLPEATIYCDSVLNIRQYLDKHKVDKVDAIISGLPWAAFSPTLQDSLMTETLNVLSGQGCFATFAYIHGLALPPGIRFKKKLRQHFSVVDYSPIVWYNLPPAFVYKCKK